jgi:hypothetical protein
MFISGFCWEFHFASAKMLESQRLRKTARDKRIEKIQARVNELDAKLSLSPEQKKAITKVLTESKDGIYKFLEESAQKVEELKKKAQDGVEELLIAEQKIKLREVPEEKEDEEDYLEVFKSKY